MAKVVEKNGFKWYIRDDEPTDREPLRDYEMNVIDICLELSSKKYVFVDVGANVGKYSVIMSKYYGKVYAIEPNPDNVIALEQNLMLNHCSNVEVLILAVGDRNGKVPITLSGAQSRVASRVTDNTVLVDLRRLDEVVDKADVIKIDVEGYEFNVVKGCDELIDSCKPIFIIEHTEYWSKETPTLHKQIFKYLDRFGYRGYNINYTHWIYIPQERLKKILKQTMAKILSYHMFYELIYQNLKSGRAWYNGVPNNWWYGMSVLEFIRFLPEHVLDEPEWAEIYRRTITKYLS